MNVSELELQFDMLIPKKLSCEWDNDGLMLSSDSGREVDSVLLTLDVTDDAVDKAIELGVDAIITHHPFLFRGIKSVTDKDARTRLVFKLISHGISVFSYHTRLDALCGGVNDILCKKLGINKVSSLCDGELSMARIGEIVECSIEDLAALVKNKLSCPSVLLAKSKSRSTIVKRVAVLGGAGDKELIDEAIKVGADVVISGDISYNNIVDGNIDGVHIICAGHYYSENSVLEFLQKALFDLNIKSKIYNCGYFQFI